MTPHLQPALSVVLITPDNYATLRKAVDHLRAQSVCDQLELVIVIPSAAELNMDPDAMAAFFGHRVVEVGPLQSAGAAHASGVRAATAAIVAYVEEHSYPTAGWAEALITAHRGPWAAVGSAVCNANPNSLLSWTNLFLEFGHWVPPVVAQVMDFLPSHQTSYKRDVLLALGAELDGLLETETTLHQRLQRLGHQLFFESTAKTNHVNVSRLADTIGIQFQNYRTFAANRMVHGQWSTGRRLVYILGTPLIPAVRGWRVLKEIRRAKPSIIPILLAPLLIALVCAAFGELVGYCWGEGQGPQRRLTFELERLRHVTAGDRQKMIAPS